MANIGLKIRNDNEQQIVDIITRCHDWLANELDIESNMEFGRTCNWGRDAFHAGLWYDDTKQSVLNFRNLYGHTVRTMLQTVGHEARHAVQGKEGMFTTNDKYRKVKSLHDGRWESGMWNGEYWSGSYMDAPWEIDARTYENRYAQLVIDAGIVTEEELAIRLGFKDGEDKQYIKLEQETKDQIKEIYGKVSFWKVAVQTKEEDDDNVRLFDSLVSKVAKFDGKKTWNVKKGVPYEDFDKVWKDAKKQTKLKYRNDAVAWLTEEEHGKLHYQGATKNEMFWAAQENWREYDTRPVTKDDLVY